MVTNSAFVAMAASVEEGDVAVAGSGMFLFNNIGAVAGTSAGSAAYQHGLRTGLSQALGKIRDRDQVSTMPGGLKIVCFKWH